MKAVLQRVLRAQVTADGAPAGEIGAGLLVLLGVAEGDGSTEVRRLAEKTVRLRIFEDSAGKMNRSLLDIGGGIMIVPNFTLCADTRKGLRPSFEGAMVPSMAEPLFREYVEVVRELGAARVETGVFGAEMLVTLQNDGPVTIILDTDDFHRFAEGKTKNRQGERGFSE